MVAVQPLPLGLVVALGHATSVRRVRRGGAPGGGRARGSRRACAPGGARTRGRRGASPRRRRDAGGDLGVHGVRDRAVAGVALAAGAQLDQVHRLAGVEVEHVADPVAEAERVGAALAQAGAREALVLGARALERARGRGRRSPPRRPPPGRSAPRSGVSALPLDGEHPVALEVAEGAVVGDDLEAVAQRLEAAAGAVAAVGALADEVGEQLPRARRRRARDRGRSASLLGHRRRLEQQRRQQRSSSPSTCSSRTDGPRPRRSRCAVQPQPRDPALARARARARGSRPTRRRGRGAPRARRSSASPP